MSVFDEVVQAIDETQEQLVGEHSKSRVDVITPTFNPNLEYLFKLIVSLKKQINPNWRMILVDDGTTDEEKRDGIKALADLDERIVLLRHKENRGTADATATGLEAVEAPFVAFADHDDYVMAASLSAGLAALERSDAKAIYTDEVIYQEIAGQPPTVAVACKPPMIDLLFVQAMYPNHLTIYRSECVEKPPSWSSGSQDYWQMANLVCKYGFDSVKLVPMIGYIWRWHGSQISGSEETLTQAYQAALRSVQMVVDTYWTQKLGKPITMTFGVEGGLYYPRLPLLTAKHSVAVIGHDDGEVARIFRTLRAINKWVFPPSETIGLEETLSPQGARWLKSLDIPVVKVSELRDGVQGHGEDVILIFIRAGVEPPPNWNVEAYKWLQLVTVSSVSGFVTKGGKPVCGGWVYFSEWINMVDVAETWQNLLWGMVSPISAPCHWLFATKGGLWITGGEKTFIDLIASLLRYNYSNEQGGKTVLHLPFAAATDYYLRDTKEDINEVRKWMVGKDKCPWKDGIVRSEWWVSILAKKVVDYE